MNPLEFLGPRKPENPRSLILGFQWFRQFCDLLKYLLNWSERPSPAATTAREKSLTELCVG